MASCRRSSVRSKLPYIPSATPADLERPITYRRRPIEGVNASNNDGDGIRAVGGNADIRIGRSTVTNNGIGLSTVNGGLIHSCGTNQINRNTNDNITPNPTPMK